MRLNRAGRARARGKPVAKPDAKRREEQGDRQDIERGRKFARRMAQVRRILPCGDRVQINNAIDGLDTVILHLDEPFDRAKVIAQLQMVCRLYAREDTRFECGGGHGGPSLEISVPLAYRRGHVQSTVGQ